MAAINKSRFWLGVLAGGVVWTGFDFLVGFLGHEEARLAAATAAGLFLKTPRYPLFVVEWIVLLFLLTYILAWLYVSLRGPLGAGPWTALRVGMLVGFAMGFPLNFAQATWAPYSRALPLLWTIEFWGGAILATLVAGWVYRD
jgi:hypothetical protein